MSDKEGYAKEEYTFKETVDHPSHYNQNNMPCECIDVVENMTFNQGNAMKYIWRMYSKGNPIEQIEKAIWYLKREKRMLETIEDF